MQRPSNVTRHALRGSLHLFRLPRIIVADIPNEFELVTECTITNIMNIMHLLRLPRTSVAVGKPHLNRDDAHCGLAEVQASKKRL